MKGRCQDDWNGILHLGWVVNSLNRRDKFGIGGSIGKRYFYLCWK